MFEFDSPQTQFQIPYITFQSDARHVVGGYASRVLAGKCVHQSLGETSIGAFVIDFPALLLRVCS